jgi:hypothetical protein
MNLPFLRKPLLTWSLASAVLLAAGAATIAAQAADDKAAPAPAKAALTVTTVLAQRADLSSVVQASGSLAAWQEAIVGAEANGLRLAEVRVNVGDVVKRGQVLATFAADMPQADLAQSKPPAWPKPKPRWPKLPCQRAACARPAGQRRAQRTADQPVPDGRAHRAGAAGGGARAGAGAAAAPGPDAGAGARRTG